MSHECGISGHATHSSVLVEYVGFDHNIIFHWALSQYMKQEVWGKGEVEGGVLTLWEVTRKGF